jgi:hypothetical protein
VSREPAAKRKIKWSVTDVADRLEQAAHTLRRLPPVKVQGFKSNWPEVLRDVHEAYGWDGARVRLGPPTARQITEMDEALRWLMWLERYEVRLVWLRASCVRWKVIERRLGFSRAKLCADWKQSIIKITLFLNIAPASVSYPSKKLLTSSIQNSERQNRRFSVKDDIASRDVRGAVSPS